MKRNPNPRERRKRLFQSDGMVSRKSALSKADRTVTRKDIWVCGNITQLCYKLIRVAFSAVAEDYSSYESVYEEEPKLPQTTAKKMAATEQKKDGESEASDSQLPETSKVKGKDKAQPRKIIKPGATSKAGGQRSLASFFGGKK